MDFLEMTIATIPGCLQCASAKTLEDVEKHGAPDIREAADKQIKAVQTQRIMSGEQPLANIEAIRHGIIKTSKRRIQLICRLILLAPHECEDADFVAFPPANNVSTLIR